MDLNKIQSSLLYWGTIISSIIAILIILSNASDIQYQVEDESVFILIIFIPSIAIVLLSVFKKYKINFIVNIAYILLLLLIYINSSDDPIYSILFSVLFLVVNLITSFIVKKINTDRL